MHRMTFFSGLAPRPGSPVTTRTVPRIALAVLALLMLSPQFARAGSWATSYQCSGSTDVQNSKGSFSYPWPSSPTLSNGYVFLGGDEGRYYYDPPGDTISCSGTITTTLTWVPDYPGDVSAPGSTLSVREQGYAELNMENVGVRMPSNAQDCFGDPQTSDDFSAQSSGDYIHSFPITGSGGQYTVTLPARTFSCTGTNIDQGEGGSDGRMDAYVIYSATPDSRAVSISSGIETSYYKFTGPTTYSNRYQHQRNDDGSISVDSVLQWQEASPNNLAGWVVNDFPFTANALNFNSPVYSWTATGQGNIFYPSRQTPTFSLLVPGNGSFPAQSTLTVNVTDGDGAVGTNTYNVTWHLPAENWTAATPGAPYTTVIPSSGPLDTCIANDSVSGQWSYTEDSQGSSISLGDMFSAASGLVDPPYAAFIAAAGIVFSKTQPEQSPVHTVVFNDAWGSPYSTFEPQPQDNSLDTMSRYEMAPLEALTYQHQEYNGDQYDVHGYAGPTSEGFEQVIRAQGCGKFTLIQ